MTTPTEKHGSIHIRANNRNQKKKSAEKKSAKKRAKNEMHVCCVFELAGTGSLVYLLQVLGFEPRISRPQREALVDGTPTTDT